MTKYIIALIWCMSFWGGFITGQSAFANDDGATFFENKNKDLLNVQVDCMNTK